MPDLAAAMKYNPNLKCMLNARLSTISRRRSTRASTRCASSRSRASCRPTSSSSYTSPATWSTRTRQSLKAAARQRRGLHQPDEQCEVGSSQQRNEERAGVSSGSFLMPSPHEQNAANCSAVPSLSLSTAPTIAGQPLPGRVPALSSRRSQRYRSARDILSSAVRWVAILCRKA